MITFVLFLLIAITAVAMLGIIQEQKEIKAQIDTVDKVADLIQEMHDLIDSRKKVTELEGRTILLENNINYVVKNNDEIRRAVNHLLEVENDGNVEERTGTDIRIQSDMD